MIRTSMERVAVNNEASIWRTSVYDGTLMSKWWTICFQTNLKSKKVSMKRDGGAMDHLYHGKHEVPDVIYFVKYSKGKWSRY